MENDEFRRWLDSNAEVSVIWVAESDHSSRRKYVSYFCDFLTTCTGYDATWDILVIEPSFFHHFTSDIDGIVLLIVLYLEIHPASCAVLIRELSTRSYVEKEELFRILWQCFEEMLLMDNTRRSIIIIDFVQSYNEFGTWFVGNILDLEKRVRSKKRLPVLILADPESPMSDTLNGQTTINIDKQRQGT